MSNDVIVFATSLTVPTFCIVLGSEFINIDINMIKL